jgi:glycosyltransferase involved in cell wall biosynthesis
MKIAILSPSRENKGGVERVVFYLTKVLQDAGHTVKIFGREDVSFPNLPAFTVPFLGAAVGKRATQEQFEVIITNGAIGWNIVHPHIINIQHGTFAAAADRIDLPQKHMLKWAIRRYLWGGCEKKAVQRAKKVVAVSEETASLIEKYYGRKPDVIIPNPVDSNHFHPISRKEARTRHGLPLDIPILLTVGKSGFWKGEDVLIKIHSLLQAFSDILFLRLTLTPSKRTPRFIKEVTVPYEELPAFYSAADIFLLPSRHEGCSMSLLEAMACGTPFLTTAVGYAKTIRSQFPGLAPYILDKPSPEAFAAQTRKLMQIPVLERGKLSQIMQHFIKKFHDLDMWGEQYQKLIESL